jgi:hypothetical protein
LDERQAEGGRFAAPGRGAAEHIAAGKGGWHGGGLDRRRFRKLQVADGAQELGTETERVKSRHNDRFGDKGDRSVSHVAQRGSTTPVGRGGVYPGSEQDVSDAARDPSGYRWGAAVAQRFASRSTSLLGAGLFTQ